MVNFYNLELEGEIVTVVDLGKRCIIIYQIDDGFEMEFSKFGFGQKDKAELLNDDPYFLKYIKQHPDYLRGVLKVVFENNIEVEIDE